MDNFIEYERAIAHKLQLVKEAMEILQMNITKEHISFIELDDKEKQHASRVLLFLSGACEVGEEIRGIGKILLEEIYDPVDLCYIKNDDKQNGHKLITANPPDQLSIFSQLQIKVQGLKLVKMTIIIAMKIV